MKLRDWLVIEKEIPVPQRWVKGALTRDKKSPSPFILKSNRQKGGLRKG